LRSGFPPRPPQGLNLALFRKSKTEEVATVQRDPAKAKPWFERAAAVADTRQYDYAIECYINGLRHDPGNMAIHEALHDVALRRKVGGGKAAGLSERLKSVGNDPVDKFLNAEKLWSKDALNLSLMLQAMKQAVLADKACPELGLNEFVHWLGQQALQNCQTSKKPDKAAYIELRDHMAAIGAYDMAVHACRLAMQVDPKDTSLENDIKNLEAEAAVTQGGYSGEEGGFRNVVKDMDRQQQLEQEQAITKTDDVIDQILARRRTEYEQDPADVTLLRKLVDALLEKEDEPHEQEAIQLLEKGQDQTGQYRYRVEVGDVKMKQLIRRQRQLKARCDADPDDKPLRAKHDEFYRKRMKFELDEYTERVAKYPTDLALKYHLGVRLYAFKKYDDAIGSFQQAKADPKFRAQAHDYLGRCYMAREWFDEAVDTLRQGIELYALADDRLGKQLRYGLMTALESAAERGQSLEQAREAQKIASQLLQTDINYRDIRQRIDKIRGLVETLQGKGPAAAAETG
jgi:tetratricopeptide (TPR) repeat protein